MTVRVRIAPSPTGDPHVGTAYIALFNLIFARHHGGKFILRIEDTDQSRSRPEYEENIYKALRWCKIEWDEGPDKGGPFGPYRQSDRLPIYKTHVDDLLKKGKAYKCFCTSEELEVAKKVAAAKGGRIGYNRKCRNLSDEEIAAYEKENKPFVVRLKTPLTGECSYEDVIKGPLRFPYADIDDQVLLKSDGFPTYHLAVVVDDHLMEITHVMRGDEWISSTPKHVLLYESFGWTLPVFMHMPLLLNLDGKKLSKRKNPTSIFYYRDSGFLQEAFINFLTLMGYSMTNDVEVYSLDEIIKNFDTKRIGVSGAVFETKKLEWLNQQYIIKNIPEEHLWERIKEWSFNDAFMKKLIPLCHTRIKTFGDFMDLAQFLFINHLPYTDELFATKGVNKEHLAMLLQGILWYMEEKEEFNRDTIHLASKEVSELFGIHHKKVMMPLLFATFMGREQGLPLFDSVEILGKDRARARLLQAIQFLGGLSSKQLAELQKGWKAKHLTAFIEKEEISQHE